MARRKGHRKGKINSFAARVGKCLRAKRGTGGSQKAKFKACVKQAKR